MPRYYHPSLAGEIRPGTRETAAIGAGAKLTGKRGELIPRGELCTDNGRTVSTTTRVLAVSGFTLTNVRVWAVYNTSGELVRRFPFKERAAADELARSFARPGYVVPETASI